MHDRPLPAPASLAKAVLIFAITSPAFAAETPGAERHPFEGYTRPVRVIRVAASDSGRVAEVLVQRGDIVRQGQLLLKLDTSILEATRQVAQVEAEATARVNALKAQHEVQQRRLEQFRALVDSGRGSTEELLRAESGERVAWFNLQAAEEEQLKQRLELKEIEARIRGRHVACPIDGVVIDVAREVGEFVSLTDPHVATVVDLRNLRAVFFLPTSHAMRMRTGQTVRLVLPQTRVNVAGAIEHVGATTEADSQRVRVDVLIDNQAGNHRSGLRCLIDQESIGTAPAARGATPMLRRGDANSSVNGSRFAGERNAP